jgi:hypothetical protein
MTLLRKQLVFLTAITALLPSVGNAQRPFGSLDGRVRVGGSDPETLWVELQHFGMTSRVAYRRGKASGSAVRTAARL